MTADLRAVLFDFDGTLWDSETVVYGVFRDLYEEHGHELTLPTWSAAIGTLGGFDPYEELGRLRGLPFDVDEVRARTEERIREAADGCAASPSTTRRSREPRPGSAPPPTMCPCDRGSPRSCDSSTRRACGARS